MDAIETELQKCEEAFYAMQKSYPDIVKRAVETRLIYDLAKADAIEAIQAQAVKDGGKAPTLPVQDAMVTKMAFKEKAECRRAEGDLESAKKHIGSLESILSSVQSRAKIAQLEMSLAR